MSVPGTTVDRQCGSSLQAIHFAAQAVMSGTQDVVIAGGVECMSSVVMGSNMAEGKFGWPNGKVTRERYGNKDFYSQFIGAEMVRDLQFLLINVNGVD
jgi:acetyl-CoA acetyltransferase